MFQTGDTIVEQLQKLQKELRQKVNVVQRQIEGIRTMLHQLHQQQGLTAARIKKFKQFPADESLVGDRCTVCQDDIKVGRIMMRLDCNGQQVFCQDCVEG